MISSPRSESDVALQQLVRADEDVDLAGLQPLGLTFPGIRGILEARQHLDGHGPAREAVAEGVVVLLRQQGGGDEHRHLPPFAVAMKAARMATSVLPKPTSPQTSRSMTPGPNMSAPRPRSPPPGPAFPRRGRRRRSARSRPAGSSKAMPSRASRRA
jgi:hypothetical protein